MSNTTTILAILALLGTVGLLLVLLVGAGVARLNGRAPLARQALMGAGLLTAGYCAVLVGVGLTSRERVLPVGALKYFCEIDCHVSNAVVSATRVEMIGSTRATGRFIVVTVKTWFDPRTTSPTRPRDVPVYPNPRLVRLVDQSGKEIAPSIAGMQALAQTGGGGTPIDRPLLPDASYTTTFAFDLPLDAQVEGLWIAPDDPVSALMIGEERSPRHGRVLLALE